MSTSVVSVWAGTLVVVSSVSVISRLTELLLNPGMLKAPVSG